MLGRDDDGATENKFRCRDPRCAVFRDRPQPIVVQGSHWLKGAAVQRVEEADVRWCRCRPTGHSAQILAECPDRSAVFDSDDNRTKRDARRMRNRRFSYCQRQQLAVSDVFGRGVPRSRVELRPAHRQMRLKRNGSVQARKPGDHRLQRSFLLALQLQPN